MTSTAPFNDASIIHFTFSCVAPPPLLPLPLKVLPLLLPPEAAVVQELAGREELAEGREELAEAVLVEVCMSDQC